VRAALLALALCGCASGGTTAMDTMTEAAAAGAGALLGGPLGAAGGAGVVHLFNRAKTGDEAAADAVHTATGLVTSLGFFARWGDRIDHALVWVALAAGVALLLMPRWRAQVVAFLMGLPRLIGAAAKGDAPAAKNAVADVLLAAPRMIGAVRESPRTRPKARDI